MTKKEIQISNILIEIEIAQKKARVTLDTLLQTYFEMTEDSQKYYHERAGVQSGIVMDYVLEIGELAEKLQTCLDQGNNIQ